MFRTLLLTTAATVLALTSSAFAESATNNPTIRNRPVDWCLFPAAECGKPAADRFCQTMRLGNAVTFRGERSSQPTIILGTNALCDTSRFDHCDRFAQIVCSGGGNL
jgi:hypothetical protein